MRVVRIATRLNRGGPLRQLQALVPGLARLGIDGPVWVGEPAEGEEDASDELAALGASIERVPGLARGLDPVRDSMAWRWMRSRLLEVRPDVVHTHMGKAGALGRLAARAAGVPCVVHTLHGHHFDLGFPRGTAARVAEAALGRAGSMLVCLSKSQRRDVVDRHHVLPAERVTVIGPGIDIAALRGSANAERAAEIRRRWAPNGRPLFLWLGRFVRAKDPLQILEALPWTTPPGPRVVFAGEGPLRSQVEQEARRRGLLDQVAFVGEVRDPGTWALACDASVLCSTSEGTPVSLLEAMALGRPVVSTAVGGVEDVVEHEATGILVPAGRPQALGFAMSRLANDAALRDRLGARAAQAASAFDATALVAATAALYRRLLVGRLPADGGRPGSPR